MARTRDPLRNFSYKVQIEGFDGALGFSSVDGLNRSIEVVEYREGGDFYTPRKMPGQISYDNIVLERGKYIGAGADDFLNWANEAMDYESQREQRFSGENGITDFRKDITIELYDRTDRLVRQYRVKFGWVCDYQHEALEGDGNDVFIQRMEICHEGLVELNLEGQ